MKVVLYMAISANGMIAKRNDDTSWVSEEDWNSFRSIGGKIGNVVYGRRTYEIGVKEGWGIPVEGVLNVVATYKKSYKNTKDVVFVIGGPKKILEFLGKKNFSIVLVAGGSELNSSFMKEGLVDEIYLDVESLIFGDGIPLFAPADFEYKLKLLGIKKLSKQTIQLHYEVVK